MGDTTEGGDTSHGTKGTVNTPQEQDAQPNPGGGHLRLKFLKGVLFSGVRVGPCPPPLQDPFLETRRLHAQRGRELNVSIATRSPRTMARWVWQICTS